MTWNQTLSRSLCGVLLVLAYGIPASLAGWRAEEYFSGDQAAQAELAAGTQRWVESSVNPNSFQTGHDLFDQEWAFGTYMMSAMGLLQVVLEHPELGDSYRADVDRCIDWLLSKPGRAFDSATWREDPLESLDGPDGHAAYLGYTNLVLALYERVYGQSKRRKLHDRITRTLLRRLTQSPTGLLATYPGQTYPVDNSAVLASLAQHRSHHNAPHREAVSLLLKNFEQRYVHRETGILIQAVHPNGQPKDAPRGSGTALAAYFLSYADRNLARRMHASLVRQLGNAPLGFGMVSEYPQGHSGPGDIDSGPLLFGLSISATGFSLGSARAAGDQQHFERVYRTVHLFGAPYKRGKSTTLATGGPFGNAIMLAMLTAPRGADT